jgi:hypothetical protein
MIEYMRYQALSLLRRDGIFVSFGCDSPGLADTGGEP